MGKAHNDLEKKEFDVKSIELDVDDISESNPKVNKVEIFPVADKPEKITHNPKKTVEKKQTVDGATYKTEEEEQKRRSELPEFMEELIQVLNEQDVVTVQGSFHNWNQAEDKEEDGDSDLYYILPRHFEDWVVAPYKDQGEAEEEEEKESVIQ